MTSIEWLEMELLNKMNGTPIVDKLLFDKAKEMHKQEIETAYEEGYNRAAKVIEDAVQSICK